MAVARKMLVCHCFNCADFGPALRSSPSADSSTVKLRSPRLLPGECASSSSAAVASTRAGTNCLKLTKSVKSGSYCGIRNWQRQHLLVTAGMSGGGCRGISGFSASPMKRERGGLFEKTGQQPGLPVDCNRLDVSVCCASPADGAGTASTKSKDEEGTSTPKGAEATAIGGIGRKIGRDDDDEEEEEEEKESMNGKPSGVSSAVEEKEPDTMIKKTESYTTTMQNRMGGDLTYRHENGMNYARVLPQLIVGSCPQIPGDVDHLKHKEDVRTILCLQQDTDLEYFGVDLLSIRQRAAKLGVDHVRVEIRDFDPFSLRMTLPEAVAALYHGIQKNGGTAYVHCTAGLGRAPGAALAYMHWVLGFTLEGANTVLQSVRRCHPKLDAIREATADLLTDGSTEEVHLYWHKGGCCSKVEIAGLDIGWHNRIPLEHHRKEGRWVLTRNLPIGRYLYKYVVDGKWTYNPDAPLTKPDKSGNVNNYVEVVGKKLGSEKWAVRRRVMRPDTRLTDEERMKVIEKLDEIVSQREKDAALREI